MKLRRILMLAVLSSCLWLGAAQAEVAGFHLGLTPYVGYADWDEQAKLGGDDLFPGNEDGFPKNAFVYGGRLAIYLNSWLGVEGHYGHSPTELARQDLPNDLDVYPYGADIIINLGPGGRVVPFFVGGWCEVKAKSDFAVPGGPDEFERTLNGWEFGGGLKFMFNERISLRTEFRDMMLDNIPEGNDDWRHNFLYTAGIEFDIFGHVPDDDGDGIVNRSDKCPGTPLGATVDKDGCPMDSDGDGVFDGIDQCPNTPTGAKVDAKGCPVDSDGDGVVDGVDQCPNTPKGCTVDTKGCPLDGDADGVCDGLDQCPGTPAGCTVDASGCPVDSDGDGICDGVDQCPNTPAGATVDARGCQPMETMILDTGLIRLGNVNFDTGKATIKAESLPVLDQVGKILVNWPQLKIEIGGHTDSSGSDALNQRLSEQRAQSVKDYLVKTFPDLKGDQYTVVGYGEGQPIADNKTKEGKAQNRRVEFKVLNTEVLKKQVEPGK